MHPKIDKVQHLGGATAKKFTLWGPIEDWETDELAAVFTVVVSQIGSDGAGVVTAIGANETIYASPMDRWSAVVATTSKSAPLRAGGAMAAAWATISNADGSAEIYYWALPITLVDAPAESEAD
jgi:hypothetical protein